MKQNNVTNSAAMKAAFGLYEAAWRLAMPILRLNRRLKEGYSERLLEPRPAPADIWIQAASGGESYLAWSLLGMLRPPRPVRIFLTTNTGQGKEILDRAIKDVSPGRLGIEAFSAFFPFDCPSLMESAVAAVRPRVMVLLESELWPGLMAALKRHHARTLVVNGRMTPKSLQGYLKWPSLWETLKPEKVLAISPGDAARFGILFGKTAVETIPNMKFDRIKVPPGAGEQRLAKLFSSPDPALVVLGSIRREEESQVIRLLRYLSRELPGSIIGLFPRHMHRIPFWKEALGRLKLPWQLRSGVVEEQAARPGSVLLWDTFGELSGAYALARAVFVGGSLAPLGGQNFLEPLAHGITPVIGPSWENFAWVGQEIIRQGLVLQAENWREAGRQLVRQVRSPLSREPVREAAQAYVNTRRGGTARACQAICQALG